MRSRAELRFAALRALPRSRHAPGALAAAVVAALEADQRRAAGEG
jgi:hypothetical protein